jgi:hypothetical protein
LIRAGGDGDFLFELPAAVATAMSEMRDKAQMVRRACRGLAWLMGCKDSGILDDTPELKSLLDRRGGAMLDIVKAKTAQDAEIIGRLCYAEA